jgi:hypothetical protein
MKNKFVADGYQRFLLGKNAMKTHPAEMKQSAEFAKPNHPSGTIVSLHESEANIRAGQHLKNHKPSAATLW